MTPPIRVFLSAAGRDQEAVARLGDALAQIGIEARTDADIAAGADWGDHLRAAMESADAVVCLFTPAALSSAYVMSEVGAAIAAGKLVIPVVTASKGLPSGLPAPLRNWQFIRSANRDVREVAAEIRERLVQLPATAA